MRKRRKKTQEIKEGEGRTRGARTDPGGKEEGHGSSAGGFKGLTIRVVKGIVMIHLNWLEERGLPRISKAFNFFDCLIKLLQFWHES